MEVSMLIGVILQFAVGAHLIHKKNKSWGHLIGLFFLGWIWVIVLACSSGNTKE